MGERVEWVLMVFGSDEEVFEYEEDVRYWYKRAVQFGALASIKKRTITEEPINAD